MKTRYYYKGVEIRHTLFLSMCRNIGIHASKKESAFEVLKRCADNGNAKAQELLEDLQVILDE